MTTIACKWHTLLLRIFQNWNPDIEFKLSQPNYTVNTFHLEEKYPNHEFSLIMGKTT
jgi:hypothetical protein